MFARYTHRFPTGRLHAVAIRSQYQSVIDICAQEGPDPNPNRDFDEQLFCLDMVLNRPKGNEVFGGWRQRADAAGPEDGGFDCFGDVRVENNC